MSLLILGACGAVVYNVLMLQTPKHKNPGSTAVRVQVKDIDVASVPREENASSIGQLLSRTQSSGRRASAKSAQNAALTASIQKQLVYLGFYNGAVDGYNGPQTFAAIKQYQQQNSLKVTGDISAKLLDHLKFTRKISDAGNITGSVKASDSAALEVRSVQERLIRFGYAPGNPDGVFGSATRKAIKRFEADRSMPITGRITKGLLQELGG